MMYTLALACLAARALAGGVTSAITPPTSPPAGCVGTISGPYVVTIVNATTSTESNLSKRGHFKRATNLIITLNNGIMKDPTGDTGYIASNDQFQFDNPPQAGAIYTAGWSICPNGTIALGGSTIFWDCASGSFGNLYDVSQGGQCSQIFLSAQSEGATTSAPTSSPPATPTSGTPFQNPTTASNFTTPSVTPYTGGAIANHPDVAALAAGVVALLL